MSWRVAKKRASSITVRRSIRRARDRRLDELRGQVAARSLPAHELPEIYVAIHCALGGTVVMDGVVAARRSQHGSRSRYERQL